MLGPSDNFTRIYQTPHSNKLATITGSNFSPETLRETEHDSIRQTASNVLYIQSVKFAGLNDSFSGIFNLENFTPSFPDYLIGLAAEIHQGAGRRGIDIPHHVH